jgi:hypothetical protein
VSNPNDPAEREAKAVASGQGDSVGLGLSAGVMRKEADQLESTLTIDPAASVCPSHSPAEENLLAAFASAAHALMLPWVSQRQTGNLRFDTGALDQLFVTLLSQWGTRDETAAAGGVADLYSDQAALSRLQQLLQRDSFGVYVAEIRALNPLKGLGGYARILGIPTSDVTHDYVITVHLAVDTAIKFEPTGTLTAPIEAGLYEIHYRNSLGMEWSQNAAGIKVAGSVGASASRRTANMTSSMGTKTVHSASATSHLYYGPDFFSEAEYVFVEAEAGAALVGGSVGVMTLYNGPQSLTFDTSGKIAPIGTDTKGSASFSMGGGKLHPLGSTQYMDEAGSTQNLFQATPDWSPLAVADFYFPTGSAELRGDGVETLRQIGELARIVGDSDPLLEFRALIQGSSSPIWNASTPEATAQENNQALATQRASNIESLLNIELVETLQRDTLTATTDSSVATSAPMSNKPTDRRVSLTIELRCGLSG